MADIVSSLEKCLENGGRIIVPLKECAGGRIAVIQDPAGAVAALHQSAWDSGS
ncbi:MAG TPA: hypothetical protein VGA56_04805 [Opitutaceae bacterium]